MCGWFFLFLVGVAVHTTIYTVVGGLLDWWVHCSLSRGTTGVLRVEGRGIAPI